MIRALIFAPIIVFKIWMQRIDCFFLYRSNKRKINKLKAEFTKRGHRELLRDILEVERQMEKNRQEYLNDKKRSPF